MVLKISWQGFLMF